MGIRPNNIFAKATGIAMLVVTLAALYLGMRSNFDPSIGPARLIYAFQAVIIGGLGSLWGTLAGGIIIGLAQTIGAADQSRMADPGGACGLPSGSSGAPARPFPKGG
jgi:branched-chain amino acid transport system permease protein